MTKPAHTISAASALLGALCIALFAPASSSQAGYVPHSPIIILGDSEFTASNGVVAGSGTQDDPYVIAGWDIQAQNVEIGILVLSENANYRIENNRVSNARDTGILAIAEPAGATPHASFRNNFIQGNLRYGLDVEGVVANVSHNTFATNGLGIGTIGSGHSVWKNEIRDNKVGIDFDDGLIEVHENNIYNNLYWGAVSEFYLSVDVTPMYGIALAGENYWGDDEGPRYTFFAPWVFGVHVSRQVGPVGPGTGDVVGPGTMVYPWKTEPIIGAGAG